MAATLLKVGLVIFFFFLNVKGVREMGGFSAILTVAIILAFAAVAVVGLMNWNRSPVTPFIADEEGGMFRAFGAGLGVALWMYCGFEQISMMSGEIQDAHRMIPKALMVAIPIISLTYILPTLGGLASIGPWDEWTTETGGVGVDFSEPLYKAGLLRDEPVLYNGVEVVPFDFVMNFIPAAPKTPEEVKAILDEGLVADAGAMCVEAYGMKDGRKVCSQVHVMAPGIVESYERAGMTGEQYLTGQGGFLFTKMFVNDIYDQKGLISSDQLSDSEVDYYFDEAAKLGITLDCRLEEVDEFPVDKE